MRRIAAPLILIIAAFATLLFVLSNENSHRKYVNSETRMALALPGLFKYFSTMELSSNCETTLSLYLQAGMTKGPEQEDGYLKKSNLEAIGTRYIENGCKLTGILVANMLLHEHLRDGI